MDTRRKLPAKHPKRNKSSERSQTKVPSREIQNKVSKRMFQSEKPQTTISKRDIQAQVPKRKSQTNVSKRTTPNDPSQANYPKWKIPKLKMPTDNDVVGMLGGAGDSLTWKYKSYKQNISCFLIDVKFRSKILKIFMGIFIIFWPPSSKKWETWWCTRNSQNKNQIS